MKKFLIFLVMFCIVQSVFADGYDYDVGGQLTAQAMKYATGGIMTLLGIVGIIIAAWKWKVSGNHSIIIIALVAVLFITGAATLVSTQKEFATALFQKQADANGTFK